MTDANGELQLPQTVVDYEDLNAEEKKRVQSIMDTIDVGDTNQIIQYGVAAQSKISGFADTVLEGIRNKDTGYVGEVMTQLMMKIKDIDVDSLSSEKGFFGKLFASTKNIVNRFITRYEKLSVSIEKIVDELEKARIQLLRDITMLDKMFEKNLDYLRDLDLYVIAGQRKLQELKDITLPELQKKAQESGDPLDAQKANDFAQLINRFEKKLHDLKLSRMLSIQTAPQIRLIQNNNQVLVEKIQSSILNTIPLWKNQIIIAISLMRQKKNLELQKTVTDTTNQLLQKNSEMLKQGSIEVAKESERGIVEIETLKKVNSDLITIIEETLKIQQEGTQKRAAAEVELRKMEEELKQKLIDIQKNVPTAAQTISTMEEQAKLETKDELEILPLKQNNREISN